MTRKLPLGKLVLGWRVIVVLAAAVAATGLTLIDTSLWKTSQQMKIALIWVAAGPPAFEQLRVIIQNARQPKRMRLEKDVTQVLLGALKPIAEATTYNWYVIGISAFRVKGYRWSWPGERLERIARVRPSSYPGPTDVRWTIGKGIIGKCWEDQKVQHEDLRSIVRKYAKSIDEEAFKELPSKTRMGLGYKDFRAVIGKYAEVLAVPIINETAGVLGCVAIDVPYKGCETRMQANLGDQRVWEVTQMAADTMSRILTRDNL